MRSLILCVGLVAELAAGAGDDKAVRMPSPDRRWDLIMSPISEHERALDLKDAVSGREKRIKTYDRSLRVGWSPDSRAFYMNDAFASNREDAYLYLGG